MMKLLNLLAIAIFLSSCENPDEPKGSSSGSNVPEPTPEGSETVKLPDDSFFQEFAYPGASTKDALEMGDATSVWYKTSDDFSKITSFYSEKFAGGNNHVEEKRGYFALPDQEGGPIGATVTLQPDGTTQIILKREK